MMIRRFAILLAAAAALSGCVIISADGADDAGAEAFPPTACQPAKYASLVGKTAEELERMSLPSPHRIVCHDCMVTQDYAPNRLNVRLGPDGRVASVDCG